jgi:hypothetical protein
LCLREELSEIQKRLMDAEGELGKMHSNVTYFNQGIIYLKYLNANFISIQRLNKRNRSIIIMFFL